MWDAKTAWRKMSRPQRIAFLEWLYTDGEGYHPATAEARERLFGQHRTSGRTKDGAGVSR
ncbi:unnamed protein product [marine sediment metagenome]|uniref:Uncharacterized protein n=1 Tax=marine sediment metagenome TaxID=412755 RepID=X0V4C5_9ZZZZ